MDTSKHHAKFNNVMPNLHLTLFGLDDDDEG